MQYVVVGAGAIGGTVGARLARDGHDVLLCDANALHVEAIERDGVTIEGPVEQLSVRAPAALPDDLPDEPRRRPARRQGARYADGTCRDRSEARRRRLRRLASERHQRASDRGGRRRGAHGRRLRQLRRGLRWRPGGSSSAARVPFTSARSTDGASQRVDRLVGDIQDAEATDAILGYLWSKQAYGAMLFATAVSDLPIADALAEPRYRHAVRPARARRCSPRRRSRRRRSTGSTPRSSRRRSNASWSSTGARPRRTPASTATSPCASERRRQRRCSRGLDGPNVRRTLALIRAIEDGRRRCETANLELLAALCPARGPRVRG